MNPLNQWIRIERMDEENPRFEDFMKLMIIENRSDVEKFSILTAFKLYKNGVAWRANKQLLSSQGQGQRFLKFAGINVEAIRFDDYYHTGLNTVYLYELNLFSFKTPICPHCYHLLTYDFNSKNSHCTKCDYIVPL